MTVFHLPWKPVDYTKLEPGPYRIAIHDSPSQTSFRSVLLAWEENSKDVADLQNTKAQLEKEHDSGEFEHGNPFARIKGEALAEHDSCILSIPEPLPNTVPTDCIKTFRERLTSHRQLGESYKTAKKKARLSFRKVVASAERYATKKSLPLEEALNIVKKRIAEYNKVKFNHAKSPATSAKREQSPKPSRKRKRGSLPLTNSTSPIESSQTSPRSNSE